MGKKYNYKHLPLSLRRKSMKKGWIKRRRMLRQEMLLESTAQAENAQNTEDAQNTENATNIQIFVADGILPDLSQIKEEKADDYEKPLEAYEKENICNSNIDYYRNDEDNLVKDNEYSVENEEKVEIYEEYIEIYEEEGDTHNENVEKCEEEDSIIDNKEDSIVDKEDLSTDNKDLIIDNKQDLIVNNIPVTYPVNIPAGRYIVDFSFMWNEMHRLFDDHAQKPECQFKYWQLVNFFRRGLLTQLWFQCQICKLQASLWTEPIDLEKGINVAAATGCAKADIGYSKMKKLCTAMNIKCMSEKTYIKNRNNLVHKKTVLKNTRADSF
ncbi:uncharacterized protein LOC114935270 [Nylanderia fulva]|uniref:uncharacterized protein LOC114935270 n=1 Tax=Nylanderia fulva TaxID=613905 RepID=UPI0010FBA69E|nr:uncharacterized protein LOC114935270 [Nylanderia fulva]